MKNKMTKMKDVNYFLVIEGLLTWLDKYEDRLDQNDKETIKELIKDTTARYQEAKSRELFEK